MRTGNDDTGIECGSNLGRRQFANSLSDQPAAKIAIRRESICGRAVNMGMPRKVHCVGDDGRSGVGHRRVVGEDGDGVSDAE